MPLVTWAYALGAFGYLVLRVARIYPRYLIHIMPFLLIVIGLFILADTPTDVFGMVPARW